MVIRTTVIQPAGSSGSAQSLILEATDWKMQGLCDEVSWEVKGLPALTIQTWARAESHLPCRKRGRLARCLLAQARHGLEWRNGQGGA